MNEPDSTDAKILNAARTLFVKHGFAATSMSKIAALAKVNHSLIFHHFGNKQKLWLAVKQSIVEMANERETILPSLDLPLKDFIRQLFNEQVKFFQDNPDIVQMLNWQRIEAENQPDIGLSTTKEAQAWMDAFKYYQQRGDINPDLRPEFIMTMICSISNVAVLAPNIHLQTPEDLNDYLDFCTELFVKAVQA